MSSNNLVVERLKKILVVGQMYNKQSMKMLLQKGSFAAKDKDLKYAMKILKDEKYIKYLPKTKFWVRLNSVKDIMKADNPESIDLQDLFNQDSLFNPKNVIKLEDLMTTLEGYVDKKIALIKPEPIDAQAMIEGIDRVATRVVVEKLKEVTADQYEEIITATVKTVVRSEFKLNVVPTLLTNLRSHVDSEIQKQLKNMIEINSIQDREVKKYENLFEKLKQMLDAKGGTE